VSLARGPLSLASAIGYLIEKVAVPVYKAESMTVGIRHADHVALSIRKSWHYLHRQAAVLGRYSSLADSGHGVFFTYNLQEP
jgi:hypothetical protein